MKQKKENLVIVITAFAIIINLLGRDVATKLNLPLWFDSFGTIFIAYVYGPVCGGIVGLVNNIIYGIFVEEQSIYCLVGTLIGVITGILAKKGVFESPFNVMTLGAGLSLICTMFAVPINIIFYDSKIGNIWGNQVYLLCVNNDIPRIVACVIAQFYIEFLDKLISVYGVYLIIQCIRHYRRRDTDQQTKEKKGKKGQTIAILLAVVLLSGLLPQTVLADLQQKVDETTESESYEDYDTYTHTIYGSDAGLLAGEANDIVQTKDGQLWVGTYAGLYSYDGTYFKQFRDIDSIKNVNDLYVDEEGRLWVGTNDNGVTMVINGRAINVVDTQKGLLSNSIKSIVCDSNGYYYIGSTAGVSIITLNGGVNVYKNFPQVKNTKSLAADAKGQVIAITDNGELYSFVDGELEDTKIIEPREHTFKTVFISMDDKIYIGTDRNTVLVYSNGQTKVKEQEITCEGLDNINAFFETEDGETFICSDSGIGYFDKAGQYKLIHTERFTSSIDNMMVDYQGNLWFSSSRQGLIKLCKSSFTGLFAEVGEEAHVVNAVMHFNGQLFCGADDGLYVIDEEKKQMASNELTELLAGVRIRNLSVDSANNLWISTSGNGLYKVTSQSSGYLIKRFYEDNGMPGKRVRGSIELHNGDRVAVGDEGIAFLHNDVVTKTITAEDNLVNIKSLCVLEYAGKIYVGSDGGGISVIHNQAIEKRITKEDGLSSDVILRMVYDEVSKGVFIVTSNGLCYMNPEGDISYLDKFPYSNNYDIIPRENGNVWVLSSAGIYVASSEQLIENKTSDYDLLNSKRGLRNSLTANSYSYVRDGKLYLCCDSEVVTVDISDDNFSAKSYRMSINSVKVDGHAYAISRTQPLYLSADAYNITFEPQILNYSLYDPFISYRLEGVDEDDKVVLLSELKAITYNNIKPGKYTFKISVLDSSKQHVIESGRYEIIKEREMYQYWWFKLYMVVIATIMISWATWFITKSRIQKTVLKQKLELEYAKKQIEMGNETILSIAKTVDAKDSNTSQHSFRVSEYSVAIARRLGYDEEKCESIRQMALLHDIGKIGIPDAILNKPGKLTDEEYEVMKSHVLRGGEILKDFTLIENVNVGALYHHERYDGTGYYYGLKGEEIPIEARIIGIADAFDAMTANRVYRKQLDIEFVISELKKCRGTQFDPKLTDIMLSLIGEGIIDVEALYHESKEEM